MRSKRRMSIDDWHARLTHRKPFPAMQPPSVVDPHELTPKDAEITPEGGTGAQPVNTRARAIQTKSL